MFGDGQNVLKHPEPASPFVTFANQNIDQPLPSHAVAVNPDLFPCGSIIVACLLRFTSLLLLPLCFLFYLPNRSHASCVVPLPQNKVNNAEAASGEQLLAQLAHQRQHLMPSTEQFFEVPGAVGGGGEELSGDGVDEL